MVKNLTPQDQLVEIARSILLLDPVRATVYDWIGLEDRFEQLVQEIVEKNVILKFETIEECQKFCELITLASCKVYVLVWYPLITEFMINVGIDYLLAQDSSQAIVLTCATALSVWPECADWSIETLEGIVLVNSARLNEKPPISPLDFVTDTRRLYQQNKCDDFPLNFEQFLASLPKCKQKLIKKPVFN
ncbi:MAG: hypothetical protein WC227_03565 [Patescibacteria group bacterium]|jgi:hypothetical protein